MSSAPGRTVKLQEELIIPRIVKLLVFQNSAG